MNATPEEWRPVVGYEGFYEVSDQGHVRSIDRSITRIGKHGIPHKVVYKGHLLRPAYMPPMGYGYVSLNRCGRARTLLIHALVLEAFHGPRPAGMVSCHNDGNANDNRPSNLRWDTQASNMRDRFIHAAEKLPSGLSPDHKRGATCIRGHEYLAENTYINPSTGRRTCRQCKRDQRGVKNPRGPRGPRKP